MTTRDRALAALVVALWGINFLAIDVGLDTFDPFFFAALRFLVMAVPVVLFVRRPAVRPRWLVVYGLGFGVGQFAFLFTAMHIGLPPGLASLVLQSSVPFTVLLGTVLLGERLSRGQALGLVAALGGMGIVLAAHRTGPVGIVPVALALAAGFSWAVGNIGTRKAASGEPFRLTMWMSVVATGPLLALSAVVEGPAAGWHDLALAVTTAHGRLSLVGLAYVVLLGTIAGSGLYVGLMARYPASTVAPLSLMVPVVGLAAAALVFGERPSPATLIGGAVVIAGALATQSRPRPSRTPGRIAEPVAVG